MALYTMVSELAVHGAYLLTISDLLGVPDHTVWSYGQSLRRLAKLKNYKHVEFARLKDLLGIPSLRDEIDEMA